MLLKALGVDIVVTAFLHYEEEIEMFGREVLPFVRELEKSGRGGMWNLRFVGPATCIGRSEGGGVGGRMRRMSHVRMNGRADCRWSTAHPKNDLLQHCHSLRHEQPWVCGLSGWLTIARHVRSPPTRQRAVATSLDY